MWRSFGGSSGMGRGGAGGGGSGGGGEMFRTISRVSRASLSNLQDAASSSSSSSTSTRKASKRGLSLGSKSTAMFPISVAFSHSNSAWPLSPCSSVSDESDWVRVDGESSCESEIDSFDDCVFGSAPSPFEAQSALLSVQHALPTLYRSESDWIEPSMYPYGFEHGICPGMGRVYDAFHLLQTEPSVQRMVISLSSDRAVWNAVLNNEAVRELREAFYRDEANALESPGDEPNPPRSPNNVLGWIFDNMRAKFMDFLAGITDLMKELFQPPGGDDTQEKSEFPEGFGELVRAAFMLTAIVLLVVVVTRASNA